MSGYHHRWHSALLVPQQSSKLQPPNFYHSAPPHPSASSASQNSPASPQPHGDLNMTTPERSCRRSQRQWDPQERTSTLRDPIGHVRKRTGQADITPRGESSRTSAGLNPSDGVFSPFERAKDLMKSHGSGRIAWNAPHTTGHESSQDNGGSRSSRAATSRPSSSLGSRSSSSRQNSTPEAIPNLSRRGTAIGRRSSSTSRSAMQTRKSESKIMSGVAVKTKASSGSSSAQMQKTKNRERAFKARQEDLARMARVLEQGCRMPKLGMEGLDVPGPVQEVPSLQEFVELQSGVVERWNSAKDTALAALEAVAEAEKMMEYLAEFGTNTEDLKRRKWDVGVNGFLSLNQLIEKDLEEQAKKEDEKESKQDLDTRKGSLRHEMIGVEGAKSMALDCSVGQIPSGVLHVHNDINTGRSMASVSSSSSGKSVAGSSRESGPEDTSTCVIKTTDSCDRSSPCGHESVPAHLCRPSLVQWSSSESVRTTEACKVFVRDLQGAVARFQAETEIWFLKVIENAFVNKNRRGVYSKEDCCTLLKTLSKVQDWLETEPAKSRAAANHPQDIRLLVRDTVIYWGSQLFFLPSVES